MVIEIVCDVIMVEIILLMVIDFCCLFEGEKVLDLFLFYKRMKLIVIFLGIINEDYFFF